MRLISIRLNGLKQHFAKLYNIIKENGLIFAPSYGAGKRKAGSHGTPEQYFRKNDASASTTVRGASGTWGHHPYGWHGGPGRTAGFFFTTYTADAHYTPPFARTE